MQKCVPRDIFWGMARDGAAQDDPAWVDAEVARIRGLPAEGKLTGIWGIQDRLGREGDVDGKVRWIKTLFSTASDQGRFDFTLKGFGELRRMYATDPACAHLRGDVLWYFKWIVEHLPEYADVSRETIEKVFADMQAFYVAEGESQRPVYSLRCQAAVYMGDTALADEYYAKWQDEPQGNSDDCAACEADREIIYLMSKEEKDKAVEVGTPILKGEVGCDDTPAALTRLMGALFELDRRDIAFAIQQGVEKYIRRSPGFLSSLGGHVLMALMVGKLDRSRRLATVALMRVRNSRSDMDNFSALRSVGLWAALAAVVSQMAGKDLRLAATLLPGAKADATGKAELVDVATACLEEAQRLATALDKRNGTARFTTRLDEVRERLVKMTETRAERRGE